MHPREIILSLINKIQINDIKQERMFQKKRSVCFALNEEKLPNDK
jgi:hypothetical protein